MTDFKLFARDKFCKKWRFIIAKQKVMLPVGKTAISKDLMCGSCARKINRVITKPNKHGKDK